MGARDSHSDDTPWIVASIDNYQLIEAVYGESVAKIVRSEVFDRARVLSGPDGMVGGSKGRLLLVFAPSVGAFAATGGMEQGELMLERVLQALGGAAITSAGPPVFAVISAEIVHDKNVPLDLDKYGAQQLKNCYAPNCGWRDQYAADMDLACKVFDAIERDLAFLDFEPICDVSPASKVIYREALLRFAPGSDLPISPLVCILALERLGLVRQLDQWVVSSVIAKLAVDPEIRLGCNISAQSAVVDGWWGLILAVLRNSPELAKRLIVEITETSQFPDVDAASNLVMTLRSLKCLVALDDIGDGYSTVQTLSRIAPDVTKIDRTYLHAARANKAGSDFLERLIALAKLCSGAVVVEGVETEEDLRIARSGGATWVQGYWLNKIYPMSYEAG